MPVSLESVSVGFAGRVVLQQTAFQPEVGTFDAILGPSGSGKTTVLGTLAGNVRPSAGRRRVLVNDLRVAWMTQATVTLRKRTTLDNVAIGALPAGMPMAMARSEAATSLQLVGLADLVNVQARNLSGGEQQRLTLARALVGRADLILADEPTAALDASNVEMLANILRAAAESGVAVVAATHDPKVARRAHRVWTIRDHQVVRADA